MSVEVNPLQYKLEVERRLDDLRMLLKESIYEGRAFIRQNTIREKVGFYVNQKQVDDLRDLIGRVCLQGGDVKRRVSTSAYHIKNTLVWKLEKRQHTPGSMTLKQVYDLIYKYIGQ